VDDDVDEVVDVDDLPPPVRHASTSLVQVKKAVGEKKRSPPPPPSTADSEDAAEMTNASSSSARSASSFAATSPPFAFRKAPLPQPRVRKRWTAPSDDGSDLEEDDAVSGGESPRPPSDNGGGDFSGEEGNGVPTHVSGAPCYSDDEPDTSPRTLPLEPVF
jgi:hypothetical protein